MTSLLDALGAAKEGICYEPAECWRGCEDRNCPYTHHAAWFIGEEWFGSRADAEAALRARAAHDTNMPS